MSHSTSPERFKRLWTTEHDQWFLVKGTFGYYIRGFKGKDVLLLSIRKKDEHQYVVQKMLENNNKIYSKEEFLAMANSE